MKILLCFLSLLALASAQPPPGPRKPGPPPQLPAGITAKRDVQYVPDGGPRRTLDVYFPEKSDKPLPLVVWIHGGAWRGGSKDRTPALPLLAEGFAVASVTYRFSQDAPFPAQIEDCKAAIRWLRAHAKELHIDPARIGVWGSSAGGHLVAMLGTAGDMKEWDKGENLSESSRVQAVCDWFGPAELLTMGAQSGPDSRIPHDAPDSPEAKLVGGPLQDNKDKALAASPLTYVSADDPPFLIMHGDRDALVPLQQSVDLQAALKKAGVDSTLRTLEGSGHGDGGFRDPASFDAVKDFFIRTLKK
jgi:acetyl esterase/lipase